MRAAIIERLGEAPVLRDVPEPQATDGVELVRVRAAAIKNIERMLASGTHYASVQLRLPAQVGMDAVVELSDGRRVYAGATPPGGSMAEWMMVDPSMAIPVPDDVDDLSAAAVPNAGVSAWLALEYSGQLQPSQSVLVLGATGVTGALSVQLAKRRFDAGHVVAVGRNAERLEALRSCGADQVLDLAGGPEQFRAAVANAHAEHPFDLVLDYLWGDPAEQTLRALGGSDLGAESHRTRFVQIGEMAGPEIALPASVLRSTRVELMGQGGGSVPHEAYARVPAILLELFDMLSERTLTVDAVARPLADVTQAWNQDVPSGTRIVLTP